MEQIVLRPEDWVMAALVVATILLFVRTIMLNVKLKRLRKGYMQFMSGTEVGNIEHIIIAMKEQISKQEQELLNLQQMVKTIGQTVKKKKGNVSILRYNPFGERGNDSSFSLAIVDDKEDGMVLSGLQGREQTFLYAKPVKQGESPYPLTPEERQAIIQALQPE